MTNKQKTNLIYGVEPYDIQPSEEYMNSQQIEHFTKILTNMKQELLDEVDATIQYMQDKSSNLPDPNDRASQEEELTLKLKTQDRENKLIKKIDEALVQLNNKEYGYCEECGIEIGVRRLEARPTASLCIDCKTLREIKEKQIGG